MSELPPWYPGSENKVAPMPLLRVQAFVNTLDLEEGTDLLADRTTAQEWLVQAGLLDAGVELSASELEFVRTVREAMRELIGLGGRGTAAVRPAVDPLRELAEGHRARVTVGDGGVLGLESGHHGEPGDGLFELLLIIRAAQVDGSWSRLKLCANDECRWAFYDRSRNQQGNWCNMAVCGNRLKNRQLRARRR